VPEITRASVIEHVDELLELTVGVQPSHSRFGREIVKMAEGFPFGASALVLRPPQATS
jgi:hypothetical protein